MARNPYLKSAEKVFIKQNYYTRFADDNALEIAVDEHSKVFGILVIEEDQFPGIVLSLALDFYETYAIADMVINLMHIAPVALGEAFYRSRNGQLYWENDAAKYFTLEHDQVFLGNIEIDNKSLH